MSTRDKTRRPPPAPDVDGEEEVDLGRYWSLVAARWWLPLLGLIGGAAIGYLLALGGGGVYVARVTAYLGQPFSPTGSTAIQSPNTNPRTVNILIHSDAATSRAASRCGLSRGKVRSGVSSSVGASGSALGTATKGATAQYATILVRGSAGRKTRCAADQIARFTVANVSGYVDAKIAGFDRQLAGINDDLKANEVRTAALNQALKVGGLSALDKLVLVSQVSNAEDRRAQLLTQQTATAQLLALAQQVEKPRLLGPATVAKTTARSKRNSAVVGAFLGLLLGVLAALLWDRFAPPVAPRSRL